MHTHALRRRILLALGLPGIVLPACKESPGPVAPTVVELPRGSSSRFSQPPSGSPIAVVNGSTRCELDEVKESVCGVMNSFKAPAAAPFNTCGQSGDDLEAFGRARTIERISMRAQDPALASFAFDVEATRDWAAHYARQTNGHTPWRAACCYSRCARLDVTTDVQHAIPAQHEVVATCVPMPERGTSVPASQMPSCPMGMRFPNKGDVGFPFLRASGDQCCYATTAPRPLCPPGETMTTAGVCQRRMYRGRPIREDGRVLIASPAERADWSTFAIAGASREVADNICHRRMAPVDQARAARWERDAAAEHASVAAFAKLALELLAWGAPPDLVDGCHVAAREEIEHARLAYGLASRFAGRTIGPGPLRLSGGLTRDLVTWACETFEDGCVGESVAAIEAAEALSQETDAEIAHVLRVIADDEASHASLAFRMVAWAIEAGGQPVAVAIASRLEALRSEIDASTRGRAILEVVIPCTEGLLHACVRARPSGAKV